MAVLFGDFQLEGMVSGSANALHLRHTIKSRVQKIVDNASIGGSRFPGKCTKKQLPSGLLVGEARGGGRTVCLWNQIDRHRNLKKLRLRADVGRFQCQALSKLMFHSKVPLIR